MQLLVLNKSIIINRMTGFLQVQLGAFIYQIFSIPIFIVTTDRLPIFVFNQKRCPIWDSVTSRMLYIFLCVGLLDKFEIYKPQNRGF